MKILVFGDVHGNLSALQSLVKSDDFKKADMRIFMGDAVSGCASPDECVKMLATNDCICLLGNNDIYTLNGLPLDQVGKQSKLDQNNFASKALSNESKDIIYSWERSFTFKYKNTTYYFVHYPWESQFDVIDDMEKTDSHREQGFKGINADYIFFAHEHNKTVIQSGQKTYYAIASLGLSKNGKYVLINIDDKGVKIEEKEVHTDWLKEKEKVKSIYPECKGKDSVLGAIDWIQTL